MKTEAFSLHPDRISELESHLNNKDAQLLLVFASREDLCNKELIQKINSSTNADVVYGSTAGQISPEKVSDTEISFCSIELEKGSVEAIALNLSAYSDESLLGKDLYRKLDRPDLQGILLISDGTTLNGSALKKGLESQNRKKTPITGGLAGDGALFQETMTGLNSVAKGNVVGIGFYGDSIEFGFGSRGGWVYDQQMNVISKSDGNVLKEINGIPALEFYKNKLGDKLKTLPADALKYPLGISDPFSGQQLVRTVLNVDEENNTMTFAGDMPLASGIQFLHASDDQLIQGAKSAGILSLQQLEGNYPDLAILVSCVGRKLLMEERTYEEVREVKDIFGPQTCITGFYSYGELSPSGVNGLCELHNQTMTITTIREVLD